MAVLAVKLMVSWEMVTMAVHAGSVLAAGQLLPDEVELSVLVRILLPVSGLFTVTVNVMVTVPLAGTFPGQARLGLVKVTVPAVAAASLL